MLQFKQINEIVKHFNSWLAYVDITDCVTILEYDKEPTLDQIISDANKYILNVEQQSNKAKLISVNIDTEKLNQAYTEYLQLCQALGFSTKAGFQELFPAIETLKQTNFNSAIELSVKLLAINSKIQYYGGNWDECPDQL
jgi:hypothetical protein